MSQLNYESNKLNISFCLVSAIFIGASIFTMLTCKSCTPFKDYHDSLNNEQKGIYNDVVDQRQKIYIYGLVFGIVIGFIYLYFIKGTINIVSHSCAFTTIILFIQYMFYQLYPKNVYMLQVLEAGDQIDKWLDVYKHMKFRYHYGMLLGLVGYLLLSYGVLKL
jgi:hypothetical protein